MAGFRNVVLPLGIYSGAVVPPDGGFDTPIPGIRLSAGGTTLPAEGGFGTPLGVLLVRTAGRLQAGYYGIVPTIPLGGTADDGATDGRKRRTYLTLMGRTRLGR